MGDELGQRMQEPLSSVHRRRLQLKCRHPQEAVHSSTFVSFGGPAFTDSVCLDCGRHWRGDPPASAAREGK